MLKPIPPCKDCTHHEVGCHSGCEEYLRYKDDLLEYNHRVKQERIKNRRLEDAQWQAYYKYHKGTQRG